MQAPITPQRGINSIYPIAANTSPIRLVRKLMKSLLVPAKNEASIVVIVKGSTPSNNIPIIHPASEKSFP